MSTVFLGPFYCCTKSPSFGERFVHGQKSQNLPRGRYSVIHTDEDWTSYLSSFSRTTTYTTFSESLGLTRDSLSRTIGWMKNVEKNSATYKLT